MSNISHPVFNKAEITPSICDIFHPFKTKRYPQDYLRWYQIQLLAVPPRTSAWKRCWGSLLEPPGNRRRSSESLMAEEGEKKDKDFMSHSGDEGDPVWVTHARATAFFFF